MAGQLPSPKKAESDKAEREKAELRTAALARRDEFDAAAADEGSRALCERLAGLDALDARSLLAGYASIRNEIDASGYLVDRKAAGARLYFPRVSGEALEFIEVDSLDELEEGAFGVPEPSGEPAELADIEAFLVPGAVFDRQGNRLGFGRGFYDRALARALEAHADSNDLDVQHGGPRRPLIVGICHHWQLIEGEVPAEPHDISMDVIATDEETIWCCSGPPDIDASRGKS